MAPAEPATLPSDAELAALPWEARAFGRPLTAAVKQLNESIAVLNRLQRDPAIPAATKLARVRQAQSFLGGIEAATTAFNEGATVNRFVLKQLAKVKQDLVAAALRHGGALPGLGG